MRSANLRTSSVDRTPIAFKMDTLTLIVKRHQASRQLCTDLAAMCRASRTINLVSSIILLAILGHVPGSLLPPKNPLPCFMLPLPYAPSSEPPAWIIPPYKADCALYPAMLPAFIALAL